jgi:ribosomal protein S18 acetylase RimI-like enzyme
MGEPAAPEGEVAAGIQVRPAALADVPDIIDLAVEMVAWSVSPHRDVDLEQVRSFRRHDLQTLYDVVGQPHAGIFVAEDARGRFVGHVLVLASQHESSTGEPQGWVFDLSVRRDWWGRGVGRVLMQRAERFAGERGLRYLGLGVTASNRRAVAFYEALGFAEERKQFIKRLE